MNNNEQPTEILRQQVIDAFDTENHYAFSHVMPHKYTNFIDGLAWLSILAGSANLVGDNKVMKYCDKWCCFLLEISKDARNFAPVQVDDNWKPSNVAGIWYKEKPQSFAGPCANQWRHGDRSVFNVKTTAMALTFIAPVYGHLVRWIKPLRQHLNSVMFAHMLLNRKPPSSLLFAAKNNMIYSYLYGIKCEAHYRNTSVWPARNVWDGEEKETTYQPVCELAGRYMQQYLRERSE